MAAGDTTVRTFCRICEPACGLLATVKDGELAALAPDREHPVTRGFACHKGLYALDIHHDPDRLNHPQRRKGAGFERIDWNTALDEVSAKLAGVRERHGADAIGAYLGNPGGYNSQLGEAWEGFFGQLGVSRHFNANTQDCGNKFAAAEAVYGSVTIHPIPDFDQTDFLLLIGENPKVSQMSFCSIADPVAVLKGIEARGGRVVLVNPRRVETLTHLGELRQVKPDSDVYLLAALLCELDRLGHWDATVIARHGSNVEALRELVRQYPAERVAKVVGLPAEEIEQLARDFGTARRASAHASTGINMGRQGTLAYWLLQMLVFVTGNLDRPGGNVLSIGYYSRRAKAGRNRSGSVEFIDTVHGPLRKPQPPVFPWPGNLLADLIERDEQPLRALVVCAGNPVLSMGGESRLRRALDKLELLVVIDLYRNATGEHAHYLLPATDAFEREDINGVAVGLQHRPSVQYTAAVVAPRAERRHERWMLNELSRRLGFATEDAELNRWAKVDHMLRSRGQAFEALRSSGVLDFGPHGFGQFYADSIQTADQRVDCCPAVFTPALVRMAAIFEELLAEPAGLKLITRRDARMMNSWFTNVAKLKTRAHRENPLFMHPDDALARGLTEGDRVKISNAHGEIVATLRCAEDLRPGVVAMAHGWGQGATGGMRVAQAMPGVNANQLLPTGKDSFEVLSGQAHMTGIRVEVYAA